jgi:hypothetical protein
VTTAATSYDTKMQKVGVVLLSCLLLIAKEAQVWYSACTSTSELLITSGLTLQLTGVLAQQGFRLLQAPSTEPASQDAGTVALDLPPIPQEQGPESTASPSPDASNSQAPNPMPIILAPEQTSGASPSPGTAQDSSASGALDSTGALYTGGGNQTPSSQTPAESSGASPAPRATQQPAASPDTQQPSQQSGLTALVTKDPNSRNGTFTPLEGHAALTCSIPRLVCTNKPTKPHM